MFSKLIYLITFLSLLSCGLKVGEKSESELVVENTSSACLDESFETLARMFKSEVYQSNEDRKISHSLNCISQLIRDFTRHVHGAQPDSFTAEEVTYFINQNLLKNKTALSNTFIKEIFKLKVALLGGSPTALTKTELVYLQKVIHQLTPGIIELNRYMPIINQKWHHQDLSSKVKEAEFGASNKAFITLIKETSILFKGEYDLNNLTSLLTELKNANWISLVDYNSYVHSLISFKQLFTANSSPRLGINDLHQLMPLTARIYFHYLQYKNFLEPLKYEDPQYALNALKFLPDTKNTLHEILLLNTKGYISSEHILQAYMSVFDVLKTESPLSSHSIEVLLKILWSNVLNPPENRLQQSVLPGLNRLAIDRLYEYISELFLSDHLTSRLFLAQSYYEQKEIIQELLRQAELTPVPEQKKTYYDIISMINSPAPLTFDSYFLKILNSSSSAYTYHALQLSNLARHAARIVTQSYAHTFKTVENTETLTSQLSLLELEMAFNQFKNILVELDLLTANTSTFMSSRFEEANLFIARSDGNQWMSFHEAHDLALHLISGTLRAQKIRPFIVANCLSSLKTSVKSTDVVDEECLLNTYYQHSEGFEFLPQHSLFKILTPPDQVKEYFKNLLISGGYVTNNQKKVLMEDADRFTHVVQYIEMIFTLYDLNQDGIIIKDEALKAFPIFKGLIKKAVASIDEDSVKESELPGVFIYFLKYGRAPDGIFEKLHFKWFISNERNWSIESTRYELGAVFKSLAEY